MDLSRHSSPYKSSNETPTTPLIIDSPKRLSTHSITSKQVSADFEMLSPKLSASPRRRSKSDERLSSSLDDIFDKPLSTATEMERNLVRAIITALESNKPHLWNGVVSILDSFFNSRELLQGRPQIKFYIARVLEQLARFSTPEEQDFVEPLRNALIRTFPMVNVNTMTYCHINSLLFYQILLVLFNDI